MFQTGSPALSSYFIYFATYFLAGRLVFTSHEFCLSGLFVPPSHWREFWPESVQVKWQCARNREERYDLGKVLPQIQRAPMSTAVVLVTSLLMNFLSEIMFSRYSGQYKESPRAVGKHETYHYQQKFSCRKEVYKRLLLHSTGWNTLQSKCYKLLVDKVVQNPMVKPSRWYSIIEYVNWDLGLTRQAPVSHMEDICIGRNHFTLHFEPEYKLLLKVSL